MPPLSPAADNISSGFSMINSSSSSSSIEKESASHGCDAPPLPSLHRRRCVRFHKLVRGHSVLHHKDYTDEERTACWYTPVESLAIRNEVRAELRRMKNNSDGDRVVCARGLEYRLPDTNIIRRQNKRSAKRAVLVEQEMQWNEGSYDPEYIAIVYSQVTAPSQRAAREMGIHDERSVCDDTN